jgi:hypothetical protein
MKNNYLILILFICFTGTSYAQEVKINVTPEQAYQNMISNPVFIQNAKGEDFCWNARVNMDQFITNYNLTKNTEWLDAGIKYYDWLLARRDNDPEGYKGWIGPYEFDRRYIQDALVGEAILMTSILDFCVLAREDPALNKKYGDKIKVYVETANNDFFDKWDKRGCWVDDGPFGAYIEFSKYLKPDLKEWFTPEGSRGGTSHPFNKQMEVGQVSLRLYRITGEKKYKDRAVKIYFTAKSHFQYFDNHYCWNYKDPLVPADVDVARNNTRHWCDVHMWWAQYQAGEVSKIVEAYNYGIVFDKQDIQRIINTNLKVMWNGDRVNPVYINSNGKGAAHDTTGRAAFLRGNGHSNPFYDAGDLWSGLIQFDQTIRDLYELRFRDKESPRYLAYKQTVLANSPSFERKFVKGEVKVPEVKFSESKDLYLAVALPSVMPKDGKTILICKSRNPGEVQIDLYSKDGKKLVNLKNGTAGKEQCFIFTWDGKDPSGKKTFKGDYRVRWSINGGCREFPVVIN